MDKFILHSAYQPTGDQPQAIEKLAEGVLRGDKEQVLLGVTGSGKTFTMANVIAGVNKPTLVLAHNKTCLLYTSCCGGTAYKGHARPLYAPAVRQGRFLCRHGQQSV